MSKMDFVIASCYEEEGHFEKAYERFKALEGIYPYPTILGMRLEGIEKRLKKKRGKKRNSPYRLKPTGWTGFRNRLIESQLAKLL